MGSSSGLVTPLVTVAFPGGERKQNQGYMGQMIEEEGREAHYAGRSRKAHCWTGMEREGQAMRIFSCLGHQGMGSLVVMEIWMEELGYERESRSEICGMVLTKRESMGQRGAVSLILIHLNEQMSITLIKDRLLSTD